MSILDAPGLSKNVESYRRWAWSFGMLGPLPRFPVMALPPALTRGTGTSTVNTSYVNGNTMVRGDSSILEYEGSIFETGTASGGFPIRKPTHITSAAGVKGGSSAPLRVRFMTDAPTFDICFLERSFSQLNIIVDGEYAYRRKAVTMGNTGNYRYYNVNFGIDNVTYGKVQASIAITTPGVGYVVGDIITLDGGTANATGAPCKVMITQVGSNGTAQQVDVYEPGAYTTQPTGTFSQVSSTGTGTGLTLEAVFFSKSHSTRRMRKIEIIYSSPADFIGIVGTTIDTFLPYPSTAIKQPRLCVIGDSIQIGTYLGYGGSHIGCSLAQSLGLWDKLVINGIGGTGWITGGVVAWSSPSRVADFIAHQADIYVIIGSQNDGGASPALQSAVTDTLNKILDGVPNCRIVGIGNVLGANVPLASSIAAGYEGVSRKSRVSFINNQAPSQWLSGLATPSWVVTNDANHLNQEGQDYFAKISAPYILTELLKLVG